jgi:hypothetical protein
MSEQPALSFTTTESIYMASPPPPTPLLPTRNLNKNEDMPTRLTAFTSPKTNLKHRFHEPYSNRTALQIDFYFLTTPLLRSRKEKQQRKPIKAINKFMLKTKGVK